MRNSESSRLAGVTPDLLGRGMLGRFPYSILTCSHSSLTTSCTEDAMEEEEEEGRAQLVRGDCTDDPLIAGFSSPTVSGETFLKRLRNFSRLSLSLFLHLCAERKEGEMEENHSFSNLSVGSLPVGTAAALVQGLPVLLPVFWSTGWRRHVPAADPSHPARVADLPTQQTCASIGISTLTCPKRRLSKERARESRSRRERRWEEL